MSKCMLCAFTLIGIGPFVIGSHAELDLNKVIGDIFIDKGRTWRLRLLAQLIWLLLSSLDLVLLN